MSSGPVGEQIDRAFDYRGTVTVSRRDGSKLVGYVYDRTASHIEMFDETAEQRIRLPIEDVIGVELTGEDAAAKAQRIWERRKGALEPSETSIWGEWGERPVLVIVALPIELACVASALGAKAGGAGVTVRGRLDGMSVVAIAVGVGGGAAQTIAAERPRLVVTCGFAGALDPSLATGDLVLASSVRDETGESLSVADPVLGAAREALGDAAVGEVWCATQVAASADEKRALGRPGRLAVDMETWPVARAAERAGIPWLSLRVILDPLGADLPAFTVVRRETRASYIAPALRHALRGPRALAEIAQLGIRARAANRALDAALRRLAPALRAFAREDTPA